MERMNSYVRSCEEEIAKAEAEREEGKEQDNVKIEVAKFTESAEQCCDCTAKKPTWASLSFGCAMCTNCSGCHRELGSHISFVRSLRLDTWAPKSLQKLRPNVEVNAELEYHVPADFKKPCAASSTDVRRRFITAKYKDKLFIQKDDLGPLSPQFDKVVENDENQASSNRDRHLSHSSSTPERKKRVLGGVRRSLSQLKQRHSLRGIRKPRFIQRNSRASSTPSLHSNLCSAMVEYDGILFIHLRKAEGLRKADLMSDSDPYVVFSNGHQSVKSRVIDNDNNPKWDELLQLGFKGFDHPIQVAVFDEDDVSKDDLLGKGEVITSKLHPRDIKTLKEGEEIDISLSFSGKNKGKIFFGLKLVELDH